MIYTVRRWKKGFGIWHGWRWFAWRVRYVGPFGFDSPWLFARFAQDKVRSLSNAPAEARCEASPPAGCSAADEEGRVQCPDCGKLIRVTNRIDGLYVCIDCWERRYQVKFNMKPNKVICIKDTP